MINEHLQRLDQMIGIVMISTALLVSIITAARIVYDRHVRKAAEFSWALVIILLTWAIVALVNVIPFLKRGDSP